MMTKMGRPKKNTNDLKCQHIHIRITQHEMDMIKKIITKKRMTITQYIGNIINDNIEEEEEKNERN